MLDASLPTYTHQPSTDNPQNALLYFTHNGSEPSPEYLLKRPAPSDSSNQYALGLFDVHCTSVIYAEVLVKPEWAQPTLSTAELRAQNGAQNGALMPVPLVPEAFDILLYNPDQSITVRRTPGSWGKSETWDFEVPERSFKVPSASEIDKDSTLAISELAPKLVFRWKRDSRLGRNMSCYMSGRSVGGKKSKEPDITVAMFRAAKNGSIVTIYDPNMARVEVEDGKGLEVALILSAEVIRDLYLVPKHDPFNIAGGSQGGGGGGGGSGQGASRTSRRTPPPSSSSSLSPQHQSTPPKVPLASGAQGLDIRASAGRTSSPTSSVNQAKQVDAETKRVQAMVAEENRLAREREKRDQEEQNRIREMLEQEDKERRRREAEIEKETERLRKQYGLQASPPAANGPTPSRVHVSSPALPPRPGKNQAHASGALGGRPRPNSTGSNSPGGGGGGAPAGGRRKHSNPLGALLGPYTGAPGASVSAFFHRSDEDRRKKVVEKKRSF